MEEARLVNDEGIRVDGRKVDELRPIKLEAGVLNRADGSAYIEWGENKVLAAVYGPREAHLASIPYLAHSTPAPICFPRFANAVLFRLCQHLPRPYQRRGPFDKTNYGEYRVD